MNPELLLAADDVIAMTRGPRCTPLAGRRLPRTRPGARGCCAATTTWTTRSGRAGRVPGVRPDDRATPGPVHPGMAGDMKIAVGNDHRGVAVKQRVVGLLADLGHEVTDLGATGPASVDYPDYAIPVAEAVARGTADRGILICATGHGMCIAANKVCGVRAVNCRDVVDAEMSRLHNDANVLCLSADLIGEELIERMVRAWLATEFEGGRHARRVEKIAAYEKKAIKPPE